MHIEIVEFYPRFWNKSENFIFGHLKVKLPDLGINILGIVVMFRNNKWVVKLPIKEGLDHKTEKRVEFPIVSFIDKDDKKKFIEEIQKQAPDFVFKRLMDAENPIRLKN